MTSLQNQTPVGIRRRLKFGGCCFLVVLFASIVAAFSFSRSARAELPAELDENQWTILHTYENSQVVFWSYSFSPDGKRYVAAGLDNKWYLYAVDAVEPLAVWESTQQKGYRAIYSPDGSKVACLGKSPRLVIRNASNGEVIASSAAQKNDLRMLVWSRDSESIATVETAGKEFHIWTWKEGKAEVTHTLSGHTDFIAGIAFSPSSDKIASVSFDKSVRLWDTKTLKQIKILEGHRDRVFTVAYSPDGKLLATGGLRTAFNGRNVAVWDASKGTLLHTLKHSYDVSDVHFSRDGKSLITLNQMYVSAFEAVSGKYLGNRKRSEFPLDLMEVSPAGRYGITMDFSNPDAQKLTVWQRKAVSK